jgi:hypothetical protein
MISKININIRLSQNKKLYADLTNLERLYDSKNQENYNNLTKIDELVNANARLLSEKNVLEKNVFLIKIL